MEAAPTFTLPYQFLVWVVKKVLAHCDLDLVLTESYKERLEARLKNKEPPMNEDNSIESTVLSLPTHLPVPSDWISTLKPSSTRPPFLLLTPPPSPLSLPSQLTQSIPFASYQNNITYAPLQSHNCQPTLFTFNLPSSFFTSTLIQGINPDVMVANTPISDIYHPIFLWHI